MDRREFIKRSTQTVIGISLAMHVGSALFAQSGEPRSYDESG